MIKPNLDKFDIYLFSRVPYLTRIFEIILILLVVFLTLSSLPLILTRKAGPEFQTLLFMTLYPQTLQIIMISCMSLFIIVIPIYIELKLKKNALIILLSDKIIITRKKQELLYPIETIKNIYCFDPQTREGLPKEKFTIAIESYNNKTIRTQLRNYADADKIVELLGKYENINLEIFPNNYLSIVGEE
jgi:hypothetical protein